MTTAPGALRLQRQDPDQGLVVVAHVGALVGRLPLRHPPQPEQPDHVVDPDAARMAQDGAQHVAVRRVAQLLQPVRPQRRLAPVLPLLVERVRRRTDPHPVGQGARQAPRIGAQRVNPDGDVLDDAQPHAGTARCALGIGELLVRDPLQPGMEVDPVREPHAVGLDLRRSRIVKARRPFRGRQTVVLGQRAPGGEVDEPFAHHPPEVVVRALPGDGPGQPVHDLQRSRLRRPHRVPVDPVGRVGQVGVVGVPLEKLPLGRRHVGHLADVLDPDVDRVHEPPRRRQVGRRLHRRDRRGRVERVDQDEVGPQVSPAPAGQLGQVGQVADPPRPARTHRVELGHEPPGPPVGQHGRQCEPVRCHDERRAGPTLRRLRVHRVPARRQLGTQLEGRLADPASVDATGRDPGLDLAGIDPAATLELDPDLYGVTVVDVDPNLMRRALSRHHDRRQHASPRAVPGPPERALHVLIGLGDDIERRQHRADGAGGHQHVPAPPVPVVGGHVVRPSQIGQPRRRRPVVEGPAVEG